MNPKVRIFLGLLKNPAILIPLILLLVTAASGLADPKNDPFPTPKSG